MTEDTASGLAAAVAVKAVKGMMVVEEEEEEEEEEEYERKNEDALFS